MLNMAQNSDDTHARAGTASDEYLVAGAFAGVVSGVGSAQGEAKPALAEVRGLATNSETSERPQQSRLTGEPATLTRSGAQKDARHPATKEQQPLLEGSLQTPAGPSLKREGWSGTCRGGSPAW